jgi:hypothetical protein
MPTLADRECRVVSATNPLTSPTSGGRSVGIVRFADSNHGVCFLFVHLYSLIKIQVSFIIISPVRIQR